MIGNKLFFEFQSYSPVAQSVPACRQAGSEWHGSLTSGNNADVKFRLIDLEAQEWVTRRKSCKKGQRERLSDGMPY